jgi:hypothetical protein
MSPTPERSEGKEVEDVEGDVDAFNKNQLVERFFRT